VWPETGEKVDLELALLQRLAETHRPLLVKVRSVEPDSIELSALSAFLHALYTGIENIFKRIALEIDASLPAGERWHADLLLRMAKPFAERPAAISGDLCAQLGKYMQFRHVFRHAYTFELQWTKMADLVLRSEDVLERLKTELKVFLEGEEP